MADKINVTIKGLDKLQEALDKVVKNSSKDPFIVKAIGEESVRYIKGFTKAQRGEYKSDYKLSDGWKAERQRLQTKGVSADPAYAKNKPLTFTGELINSLKYRPKPSGFSLYLDGKHEPYTKKSKPITNSEIYDYLVGISKKLGFIKISSSLKNRLKQIVVREIRRRLRNYRQLAKRL